MSEISNEQRLYMLYKHPEVDGYFAYAIGESGMMNSDTRSKICEIAQRKADVSAITPAICSLIKNFNEKFTPYQMKYADHGLIILTKKNNSLRKPDITQMSEYYLKEFYDVVKAFDETCEQITDTLINLLETHDIYTVPKTGTEEKLLYSRYEVQQTSDAYEDPYIIYDRMRRKYTNMTFTDKTNADFQALEMNADEHTQNSTKNSSAFIGWLKNRALETLKLREIYSSDDKLYYKSELCREILDKMDEYMDKDNDLPI